jgi:hypothetical protein
LCGYQEEVKDDAPSFSFFQNIVSKEQGDDDAPLALNHTGVAAPLVANWRPPETTFLFLANPD